MNTESMSRKVGLSLVVLAALVGAGCASRSKDLARSGAVSVVTSDFGRTDVLTPSVYQEEGELVVRGQVKRGPAISGAIDGHMHIEQLSSDGTVLSSQKSSLSGTTRRARTRVATYTARTPWVLEPGSTIRVSMSGDSHPAE